MTSLLYKNSAAKARILKHYRTQLDSLNVPFSLQHIITTYGITNVIVAGNPSKERIVLVHGNNVNAPTMLKTLKGLVDHFSVYAVDVIGQPNLSAETRPSVWGPAYGIWLSEVIVGLKLSQVTLIGSSLGAFITLKMLRYDASRVARSFLIVPAGIVYGSFPRGIYRTYLPFRLFLATRREQFLRKFLEELMSEEVDEVMRPMIDLVLHFKTELSYLPLLNRTEAQKISTPLYLIGAEQDIFFPGRQVIQRGQAIFDSLQDTLLLHQAKHVPTYIDNQRIVNFITQHSLLPHQRISHRIL